MKELVKSELYDIETRITIPLDQNPVAATSLASGHITPDMGCAGFSTWQPRSYPMVDMTAFRLIGRILDISILRRSNHN
jgi:hypothetical protein